MSSELLQEEILSSGNLSLDPIVTERFDGLYFLNTNRDKNVRIAITSAKGLTDSAGIYQNQHPHVGITDTNTQMFCLAPRPQLNISCDGASESLAFDVLEQRRYRIIFDGQVIATDAKPSEFEGLLSARGIKTAYLAKPTIFTCMEHVVSRKITLPVIIQNTTSAFRVLITSENGDVILDNVVQYNASNIGSGELFGLSGIIGVSHLTGNTYRLTITMASINNIGYSEKWRFAITPMDTNSSLIEPERYNQNGFAPLPGDVLPSYLEGSAYWCVDVAEQEEE